MSDKIIQIDTVDAFNKLYGWEPLHSLVTVTSHDSAPQTEINHSCLNYG